jgi:hypothetical protein
MIKRSSIAEVAVPDTQEVVGNLVFILVKH